MKKSVRVCIRTRPTQYFAQNNIMLSEEHGTIQVDTSTEPVVGVLNNKNSNYKFKFDHVFHNASQSNVYDLYARDTVQAVVDGINGAIMTYGQTGSGKTFTMMGDPGSYEHRGLAARSLSQLFNEVGARMELEYKVTCTYMEIYNERVFDLLSDLSNPDQAQDFTIVEEKDGRGTFVRGLTEIEVKNETEALNLIFSGELSRTTAQHKLNRKSNRSHSIFTIYCQQRQRSGVSEKVIHSKLHLVDLAGSERLKKTMDSVDGSMGDSITRKESMNINQSLSYLEQCVIALARKSNHVPYRQSRLTNILKDCLGANCNTLMIACIWGEITHLEETVSTLRLASRMMHVQNELVSVETVDDAALVKKQAKIIKALKQELLMHDALVERTGVLYEPYTPEQQSSISKMVERYIDAPEMEEEDILSIQTYRQMLEVCKRFKKIVLKEREESKVARESTFYDRGPGSARDRLVSAAGEGKFDDYDPKSATFLGDAESGGGRGGFSLGNAPSDARPSGGVEGMSRYEAKSGGRGPMSPKATDKGGKPGSPARAEAKGGTSIDFMADSKGFETRKSSPSLDNFIATEGKALYDAYQEAKMMVKDSKQKIRDATVTVNDAKMNIDKLQSAVDARKSYRIELLKKSGLKSSDMEDIVDEEEFQLMKELREAKRLYKNAFETLTSNKQSAAFIQSQAEDTKANLGRAFADWDSQSAAKAGGAEYEDPLDDQEAFDKLELDNIMARDPESLAFFNAKKTQRALVTQVGGSIKQQQKTKRFG